MAKSADYSNTKKYNDKASFDGNPVEPGKVLVPFRQDVMQLSKTDYIEDNMTTWHFGEFKFQIGFMSISESFFASYMQEFWDELNDFLKARREGRCIIGHNPDGTPKLCPHSRHCKGCPEKGQHERFNPNRIDIISIDYEYDGETFDIADVNQPSVESQVIECMVPDSSDAIHLEETIAHFDKENPRYAQIIKLKLEGISIEDICITVGLKPSRGRQEINNTHDALCDYLRLPNHKLNRK